MLLKRGDVIKMNGEKKYRVKNVSPSKNLFLEEQPLYLTNKTKNRKQIVEKDEEEDERRGGRRRGALEP